MADARHHRDDGSPQERGRLSAVRHHDLPQPVFWLAVTFGFLFVVLWRVAGPRINAAITNRRGTINGAIAEAAKARGEAEAAAGRL